MTLPEFAARLRLALEPGTLYREDGALRRLRCARWPSGKPLFPEPEKALEAARTQGWIVAQPPYPEDFFLCSDALPTA